MRFAQRAVLSFGLVAAAATTASGDSIVLSAVSDNTLYENSVGATSNGAGQHLFAGRIMFGERRRGLLRFDIASAIPAGATITLVDLRLNMSRSVAASEIVTLHRVAQSWGEGASDAFDQEGGGAGAEPGDATWLHRFYDTASWVHPGGDFEPTPSAATVVAGVGLYSWTGTPGVLADVQTWLNNPAMNHGWLLRGNEEVPLTAKRFDSREHPDLELRPRLKIEYTPIPEPLSAASLLIALLLGGKARRRLRDQTGSNCA